MKPLQNPSSSHSATMAFPSTLLSRVRPTRLPSLLRPFRNKMPIPGTSPSNSTRRFSCIARLPMELSCLESMLPLHTAVASARLRSMLAAESQSWGMIPQGNSMPL